MVKRDERKFRKADTNNDGKLTKEEFAAFLHPEEHDHMKDIVVLVSLNACIQFKVLLSFVFKGSHLLQYCSCL